MSDEDVTRTPVTVTGIEMFLTKFDKPNGIECDVCGKRINWPREEREFELQQREQEGWLWNERVAVCPDHDNRDLQYWSRRQALKDKKVDIE